MNEVFVGICFKTRLPIYMIQDALSKFPEEQYLTIEGDGDIIYILPNDSEEGCCRFLEDLSFIEINKRELIKMRKDFWQRFSEEWLYLKDKLHDLIFTEGVFVL